MRIVADIPHPDCKITIFHWNSKYLIKLERGMFEQTYKVSELEVSGEEEVRKLLDGPFLDQVLDGFKRMEEAFYETFTRHVTDY